MHPTKYYIWIRNKILEYGSFSFFFFLLFIFIYLHLLFISIFVHFIKKPRKSQTEWNNNLVVVVVERKYCVFSFLFFFFPSFPSLKFFTCKQSNSIKISLCWWSPLECFPIMQKSHLWITLHSWFFSILKIPLIENPRYFKWLPLLIKFHLFSSSPKSVYQIQWKHYHVHTKIEMFPTKLFLRFIEAIICLHMDVQDAENSFFTSGSCYWSLVKYSITWIHWLL